MNTRTKKYFEEELENIINIHFDAKYYFEDVKYLNNPGTNSERQEASSIFFIRRIREAFWRLGIIEIAKLFQKSKNQHYNLINYLEELKENYDSYEWIKDLSKVKINKWLALLQSERTSSIIRKICIQRNKYFAHTDKNPKIKIENAQLTFNETDELIQITENILFELNAVCLKTHSDFEISGMENAGHVLEAYVALKEKRESKIIKEWDKYLEERNKKNST